MMEQNQAIQLTIDQLCTKAENENPNGYNIRSAFGEILINGFNYQMQIVFSADQKMWLEENQVHVFEVTKIN
jgi:hypothetical protein